MRSCWKLLILLPLTVPVVSATGCGSGVVSEDAPAGRDADFEDDNKDDGGRDAQ